MTKVRVSGRRDLDMGEAGDSRSNMTTDMVMEMVMVATTIAADYTSMGILELTERNKNGKWSKRSQALMSAMGPGDWRRCMEQTAQQQDCELAQLYQTIGKRANMLEMQTALQEAQWRGMQMWLKATEEKRDAYHQDNVLWGKGITDMVKSMVTATERGQREERKADTDGPGLEVSIHAEAMQTGGLEMLE